MPVTTDRATRRKAVRFVVLIGVVSLFADAMGAQESIVRAPIAGMIRAERGGTAYGVLDFVHGLTWLAGSALIGVPRDVSIPALVVFSVVSPLVAISIPLRIPSTSGAAAGGTPARRNQTEV